MNMRIIGKNMRICMEYSPYLCTVKIIPCCLIPCRLPPLLATPPSVATQVFGGISLRRAQETGDWTAPSVATQVLSGKSLRRVQEAVIGRRLLSRRKF